jgi:ABC-type antimicrobial peptide transport system permease subunit
MVREALLLVAVGAVAGIAIASIASRLLVQYLFGGSSVDPVTVLISVAALLLIAGIAVSIPCVRASRIDPMAALRLE